MQATGCGVRAAAELPPACSLVNTTSTPERPVGAGVDRDAAALVEDLDRAVGVQDHLDVVAPASASSTALSMISQTQCMRPRVSGEPMYIPGR